jgi:MOSC domain-containing protein YiiM
MTGGRVLSVNVGAVREVEWRGRLVTSGIWKTPVDGRVELRGVNLVGDDQADRTVHGGEHKAVYSYAREDYDYWREHEGLDTPAGLFGENLTLEGIDLSTVQPGERWSVGSATLEVAQPRLPCYKLGMRLGDPQFPRRFQHALRMGAYLRIIREGDVGVGDTILVTERPSHGLTLGDMMTALHDERMAASLLTIARLPDFWKGVAEGR